MPGQHRTTERARADVGWFTSAEVARVAVFAALIAVLGLPGALNLFGNAVPITLQTAGVMLAGAVLGAWRGALSVAVFLAVVAMGLPLLAGGRGGLGVFVGPSAGYLVGWMLGAAVTGWIVQRGGPRPGVPRVFAGCVLGGIVVVYAVGIPVQALITSVPLDKTALLALTFVPGDLVKAVLATLIATGTARAYPDAMPAARRERVPAAGAD